MTGPRSLMLSARVAKVFGSAMIGLTVGWATRDRIRSRGVIVSTHSPLVAPKAKGLLQSRLYEGAEARMVHAYLRTDLPVVGLGATYRLYHRANRSSSPAVRRGGGRDPALIASIHGALS